MKAIILAAGSGVRLKPITDSVPKCMVPLNGIRLIDRLIATFREAGIDDILVVGGYKFDVLKSHLIRHKVKLINNKRYQETNMVFSLFCGRNELNDDVIISYSDIVYSKSVLKKLKDETSDISTVIDNEWRKLWELRMDDPLSDAESLVLSSDGYIKELGKKTSDYKKIQSQYVGLTKISKNVLPRVINYYDQIDRNGTYDGKTFDNMYMTSFLQMLIDSGLPVKGVQINSGWVEVDTTSDLNRYESNKFYNNAL